MFKKLTLLGVLAVLAACGNSKNVAPRNLENACAIVDQHPSYLRAMKKTESKWGVPVSVQMATIYQESKFIANARPPKKYVFGIIPNGRISSAYGYSQALDGTWKEYQEQEGGRWTSRTDIKDATDFMGWYMDLTTRQLGISKTDARRQYLAYHEGRGGYSRQSYNKKPWLLRVASRVGTRAQKYQAQLQACGKI